VPAQAPTIIHASCVSLDGRGVLMIGASGRGKSALALQLMAYGASLVADDRVSLSSDGQSLIATSPAPISGLIEAHGFGILQATPAPRTQIIAVIDLDRLETKRLPDDKATVVCDVTLPLFYKVDAPHFAAAVMQFLKSGRHA
jgi:HPr kinase/phosphorylase